MENLSQTQTKNEIGRIVFKRDRKNNLTKAYTDTRGVVVTIQGVEEDDNFTTAYLTLIKNSEIKENEKLSLTEKAIQALKVDIDSLLDKLKVSLDNNNFSNYKMLINNLKDTIELMNILEHPEKENIQNYTVNVPNLEEIAKYTSKKIADSLKASGMGGY